MNNKILKTGIWIPASEAPDDLNLKQELNLLLFSIHKESKAKRIDNAMKRKGKWHIGSAEHYHFIDMYYSHEKFFLVPNPDLDLDPCSALSDALNALKHAHNTIEMINN